MKKIIINAFIIAILGLLSSTPYIISLLLEKKYYLTIDQFNSAHTEIQLSGLFITGLLQSTAVTKIILPNNNNIELKHTIFNGPIIIDFDSGSYNIKHIGLGLIETELQEELAVQTTVKVEFNGAVNINVISKPLIIQIDNSSSIDWSGVTGNINIASNDMQLESLFESASFLYHENDSTLEFKDINLFSEQKIGTTGAWIGKGGGSVEKIFLREKDDVIASLSNLNYMFDVKEQGSSSLLDLSLITKFKNMQVLEDSFAKSKIKIDFNNIDFNAAKKININNINNNINNNIDEIKKAYTELLTAKPKISIAELLISFPAGAMDGQAEITIGGPDAKDISDIASLRKSVLAKVNFSVPKEVVYEIVTLYAEREILHKRNQYMLMHNGEEMPIPKSMENIEIKKLVEAQVIETVDYLLTSNFIVEEDAFITELEIINEEMFVNGIKMPLPF